MPDIIPSTSLKVVSVHKMADWICLRKYFFHWILNLEERALNNNFWFGGVLGVGFESYLQGKNWRAAMRKEDRKRCHRHTTTGLGEDEMRLQRRLIEAYIKNVKYHPATKNMKLNRTQLKLSMPLDCGINLCGTPDATGTFKKKPVLFEIKTAKTVNMAYIDALKFDKQIYSYAANCKANGITTTSCCYCIFKKPGKKVKRNQTIDDFIKEMDEDFRTRPRFYYIFEHFGLGVTTIRETMHDIQTKAAIMLNRYRDLGKDILDIHAWPKEETQCSYWKGCEYMSLCSHPVNWRLYLRFYQQREMLYVEEKQELKT